MNQSIVLYCRGKVETYATLQELPREKLYTADFIAERQGDVYEVIKSRTGRRGERLTSDQLQVALASFGAKATS